MSITITGGITISGGGWTVSAAVANDPYFMYNTMLLPGNGTNLAQNNTFLDGSTNNFTVTRNGNPTQGTFSPYGSNWSNYFDGTGDYLNTPSNAAFGFGTGDFTIEGWFYFTGTIGTYQRPWWFGDDNDNLEILSSVIRFGGANETVITGPTAVANTWYHIAYTRQSSSGKLFVNGTQVGSTTASSYNSSARTFTLMATSGGSNPSTGYVSNCRIIKGTALYTTTFTPSTTPLTAITNTSLLTCQSNRLIDNSTNNFTITKNGDVSVQRFSPFSPTAAYSTSTIGGSGYFDGTGDYLSTSSSSQFAPAGDFTIAFWYYPITLNAFNTTIGNYNSAATTDWLIEFTSDGSANVYTNGSTVRIIGGAGTIKSNQWSFVTLSRLGTTITFKVNGTSVGTYTQSGTFGSSTKTIQIGRYYSGTEYITGYLSDVRLIDGSEVTTIPTSPLTAVSGTNLLLNFTNAGIIDNAMQNNLETVGDAQISTTQSKFGGSSMYFDGTGDYVLVSSSTANLNFAFGTGDFTIEFWFYASSASGTQQLFDTRPSGTSSTVQYSALTYISGSLNYYTAGANPAISGGAVTSGVWNHVATCRSGTSTKLFVNGTQVGSTYTDSQNYLGAINRPIIATDGAVPNTGNFTGYIDDLRITRGYARYTSNFTAPTSAFPTS
jgi:hypothetical protein